MILAATQGITGTFGTLTTAGLPALFATSLGYAPTAVTLNVASGLAQMPGATANQRAVGAAIDGIINTTTGNELAELPEALSPLYALQANQLPGALGALSGEGYASEQSVLIGDSLYSRQAILGRLRQGAYAGQAPVPVGSLAQGGPASGSPTSTPLHLPARYGDRPLAAGRISTATACPASARALAGSLPAATCRSITGWSARPSAIPSPMPISTIWAPRSEADSLLLALYAGTSAGPWNLRLGASYAFSQIDADRTIAYPGYSDKAQAEYDAGTAQAFAEIGYGFAVQSLGDRALCQHGLGQSPHRRPQ